MLLGAAVLTAASFVGSVADATPLTCRDVNEAWQNPSTSFALNVERSSDALVRVFAPSAGPAEVNRIVYQLSLVCARWQGEPFETVGGTLGVVNVVMNIVETQGFPLPNRYYVTRALGTLGYDVRTWSVMLGMEEDNPQP